MWRLKSTATTLVAELADAEFPNGDTTRTATNPLINAAVRGNIGWGTLLALPPLHNPWAAEIKRLLFGSGQIEEGGPKPGRHSLNLIGAFRVCQD
jgi:hypothetical protein